MGHLPVQGLEHGLRLLPVDPADALQAPGQAFLQELVDQDLVEDGGVQVGPLFGLDELLQGLEGAHGEGHAKPWGEDFGEASQVDDPGIPCLPGELKEAFEAASPK